MYLNIETTSSSFMFCMLLHILYSYIFLSVFMFILQKIEDKNYKDKIVVLNTISLQTIQNIYSNISTIMSLVN